MFKFIIIATSFFSSFQIAHASLVDYQHHVDWLPSYRFSDSRNELIEDSSFLYSDLRGDLKFSRSNAQLTLRPKFLADGNLKSFEDRHSEIILSEGFGTFELSDVFQVALGRQNYQWGPAELFSSSNTLFHFNYDARSFFYKENGKYLLRGSYSPNKNTSWIVIAEGLNDHFKTDYEDFTHHQKYQGKVLLKMENTFSKASDYLGLTLSQRGRAQSLGLYGNFGWNESFSLYTDSRLTSASSYYDLTPSGNFMTWRMVEERPGKMRPLVLVGARYEGEIDLRFEYLYNSLGMHAKKLKEALASSRPGNPLALYNALILGHSGREFLGQHYFYTSLRIPNLGTAEDLSLYFRHFYSFQDHSSTLAFLVEKNLLESLVGYLETDKSIGKKGTELAFLASFVGRVGVKWSY